MEKYKLLNQNPMTRPLHQRLCFISRVMGQRRRKMCGGSDKLRKRCEKQGYEEELSMSSKRFRKMEPLKGPRPGKKAEPG